VREALAAGAVEEVFATGAAAARYPELAADAAEISDKDAAALSETVTPQGLVAVCRRVDVAVADALRDATLVAVLVEPNDPGNAGAILRTADAAGADAVVLVGGVDVYNGKAVRASAGSLFHVRVCVDAGLDDVLGAGLTTLATSGTGTTDLDTLIDDGGLARPTLWLFGSEAHGLPEAALAGADHTVRVPIHGRAESLNLAAAAAVCLYASARSQRRREPAGCLSRATADQPPAAGPCDRQRDRLRVRRPAGQFEAFGEGRHGVGLGHHAHATERERDARVRAGAGLRPGVVGEAVAGDVGSGGLVTGIDGRDVAGGRRPGRLGAAAERWCRRVHQDDADDEPDHDDDGGGDHDQPQVRAGRMLRLVRVGLAAEMGDRQFGGVQRFVDGLLHGTTVCARAGNRAVIASMPLGASP
jgi:TrmH family RNA methyltransferase